MSISTNPARWLTARRLRAQGIMLALCLWSIYAWNLATPGLRDRNGNLKGTDFLHFYTLGSLAAEHDGADLYDMNAQTALAAQRVPEAAGIRYLPLYPPQVSILFAPLAHLSYGWALTMWWVGSAVIYGACCYSLWRASPGLRHLGGTVMILAAACPAFFHLIAWGQTSALALACFTLMFFLLRERREFLAGIILGCLIFKPQLGLAAAVIFISTGAWRVLVGASFSAAAQLWLGAFYYGLQPLRQWIHMLFNVRTLLPQLEPRPYQTYSLRTFWSMLIPWHDVALALYILSAVTVLGLTLALWKRGPTLPLPVRYSTLLLATVLVAPHLTVYDLVILAPAFLFLADWMIPRLMIAQVPTVPMRSLAILLYLSYLLPLSGPLAKWTHIQLAVIAMAGCVYLVWFMPRPLGELTGAPAEKREELREDLRPAE